jgi:glc operon protein GlcG
VEAAAAEAKKNGWFVAIAVVSNGGHLVHFSKMDQTQFGSIQIAIHKAKAAAHFRRPTKAFEDRVAQGGAGIAVMTLDGIIASEGGIPLVRDGKIIGAIGCSGATGAQDGQACKAGVDTIK